MKEIFKSPNQNTNTTENRNFKVERIHNASFHSSSSRDTQEINNNLISNEKVKQNFEYFKNKNRIIKVRSAKFKTEMNIEDIDDDFSDKNFKKVANLDLKLSSI